MFNLLIFDTLLIVLFALSSFLGVINFTRAGQVLIGIAVLNFTLAVLSFFGWPVLRGDISTQLPLTKQELIESQDDLNPSKQERPSRSFVFGLIGLGVVAFAVGLILIFFK